MTTSKDFFLDLIHYSYTRHITMGLRLKRKCCECQCLVPQNVQTLSIITSFDKLQYCSLSVTSYDLILILMKAVYRVL